MTNLGICYQHGQGVERDPMQAATWYRKGAEAGDELARRNLRTLQAAQALLTGERSRDAAVESWARKAATGLNAVAWQDGPPVTGDWQDLTGTDAVQALALLHGQFVAFGLGDSLDGLQAQRVRRVDLPFYPNCHLLDIQLQRSDTEMPELCSALVSSGGAALLDGTSPLLHAINPGLLRLDDDAATAAYLRFFCRLVRGEEGPFHLLEGADDLPMDDAKRGQLPVTVRNAITPLRLLNGDLAGDGWRRFEGCVLYSDGVFKPMFKVFSTGMVQMESDERIAADLPVRQRRYDGIFRTPLLDAEDG